MFELTNEQRPCFGLKPVDPAWERIEAKPSPYHDHATIAYLEGNTLRRFIQSGDNLYKEYEICEKLTEDRKFLLPKTEKGKPLLFSAANLEKRTGIGMCLSYSRHRSGDTTIFLYSHDSQKAYFDNLYTPTNTAGIGDFQNWAEAWCADTSEEDLREIAAFAVQPRQHGKFREGDVFRFKIGRRLYGYGRVLMDVAQMRKQKIPFWDILMGKGVVCAVYHIVTDRSDVTVDKLKGLNSLPSVNMMDNRLFYGDFQIIGNIPLSDREDYPIHYGNQLTRDKRCRLQWGKQLRILDGEGIFPYQFMNNAIGFSLRFDLSVLQACIEAGSNDPYWEKSYPAHMKDLRNPVHRAELEQIAAQFGLEAVQLLK